MLWKVKNSLLSDVYVFARCWERWEQALRPKNSSRTLLKTSAFLTVPPTKSEGAGQQRRREKHSTCNPAPSAPNVASLVDQRSYPLSYLDYTMKVLLMAAILATNQGGAFVLGPTSTTSTRPSAPVHRTRLLSGALDDMCVHLP